MKILFFGGKDRGRVCLEAVIAAGHEVVGVVGVPKDGMSEHKIVVASIPVVGKFLYFETEDPSDTDFLLRCRQLAPEVIVLAGYPKLIKKSLIDLPSKMCINLHAGPLPRYRGPHPMNWMLINGETQGAFSIIKVDAGVDTGPILAQEWFSIDQVANFRTLLELSLKKYPDMLVEVLKQIEEGTVKEKRQNPKDGFWCTRRYSNDGLIDWASMTSEQVYNLVRALVHPMPGARVHCSRLSQGMFPEEIIIEEVRLIDRTYLGVPGRVAAHLSGGVVVVCKDRGILVRWCRMVGLCGNPSSEVVRASEVLPLTGRDLL